MIKKTKIITWPRSGHHLLIRGLQWVMQDEMVYSEFYKSPHSMDNCPCVNVQKSHDFDLTDPIDPEMNYIIQIRGFELAVESWWKLEMPEQSLEEFRESKLEYYDKFTEKWVLQPPNNALVIPYQDLVTDKIGTLIKAYSRISSHPWRENRLELAKKWEKGEQLKRI